MPWDFGATLTGLAYDAVTGLANLTGTQFGVNQYPVSAIEASNDGGATWGFNSTIMAWSNIAATGWFAPVLPIGTYLFRITTSDDTDIVWPIPIVIAPAAGGVAEFAHSNVAIHCGVGCY